MMHREIVGLTLMSTMVAVALSGVIAVFTAKMITDQARVAKVSELIDKREAILKYYTTMLKDESTWKCTLYSSSNGGLRNHLMGAGGSPTSVVLKRPTCDFAHTQDGQYVISNENPSNEDIIPAAGLELGESITDGDPGNGWWKLTLEGTGAGIEAVDLILKICLDKDKYAAAYPSGMPQELQYMCHLTPPDKSHKEVRIRYSENSVNRGVNTECEVDDKAVVDIALHTETTRREVTCSSSKIVKTNSSDNPGDCLPGFVKIDGDGNITCTLDPRGGSPDGKVGVKPRDCGDEAMQKITEDTTGENIKCGWPLMLKPSGDRRCSSSSQIVTDLSKGVRTSPGSIYCATNSGSGSRGCVGAEY